ncbi:RluA family pseudouridine synthase [Paenibacillus radicis (ex Gao et al. 2016)]|uniref:Pseudouridine synthase n=1 Tax=Paenibacillus radicis (ex Gao et al. 2016) TaxID=1737354 RepID=A0A917MBP4_9BACL|nr:RluA family pseudouridine synthase [Paenibacillus radicis (ex Gao et al. 2016)]GGG89965.1 putative RNA pseudouridine synthase YlyB [Paenibacillus radicis (ex Gao et al. 2016)]
MSSNLYNENENVAEVDLELEHDELEEQLAFTAAAEQAGERIDKFITESVNDPAISRTQVQEWIKSGAVTVNGAVVKANYKLSSGDEVAIRVPEPTDAEIVAEPIPLNVVYEDGDVIVINKPRGMVVHPAPGHSTGTVVNALMHHCKDLSGINGMLRPGIVHRIDKDTSGLLMVAKNDLAHLSLAAQLKEHSVTRKYIALVHDNLQHDQGTIDAPLGRDTKDRKMFVVTDRNSKHAVTHFIVLERLNDYTLVELQLETGRTHQIRVHMKYIGHPLAGDPVYGRNKTVALKGQALHAAVIGFVHPRTGAYMQFEAPIPGDMEHVLNSLRLR